MAFGTIAQAIDVIVRHRPGLTRQEIEAAIGSREGNNCAWLVANGHLRLDKSTGVDRYYPIP
jgi:hypothetical protein